VRVVRLTLAYDGTDFRGWARQRDPAQRTVEGVVVAALQPVVRETVRVSVAGRTDAGVHARGQVISFATEGSVPPGRIAAALNGRLAPEVVVREARYATDRFDARFSATARVYRYVVDTSEVPDPFKARFVWHRPGGLSIPPMREAASQLIGEHDFASFCRRPAGGRSTVRHLERLSIRRDGGRVQFGIRADAFLHQMVRSLVGTLVRVGEGRLEPDEIPAILRARDRAAAQPVAPPIGLTLERVVYGQRR
jgi:tRNA pseudouridine38-40 synthase